MLDLPKSIAPTYKPFYIVATAWNNNLESDYSVELVYSPTNYVSNVRVAWDIVTNATSYTVYFGRVSGTYTNSTDAHTNTGVTIQLRPLPKTNVVLTITSINATNLASSSNMKNWTMLNRTNYTRTNPPTPIYYKALGNKAKTFVSKINI